MAKVIQREYLVDVGDSLYLAHHGNNQRSYQHSDYKSSSCKETVSGLVEHSTLNHHLPELLLTRLSVKGDPRAVQILIVAFAPQSAVAMLYLLFETW